MDKFRIVYDVNDDLLKKLIELDKTVYNEFDVGNFELCKQFLSVNLEIYTVLMRGESPIGYICFYPLKSETYLRYKMGKVKDYELTKDDILNFDGVGDCGFLLSSIVIAEEFRDTEALYFLLQGFKKKLEALHLFQGNVLFGCVSADGEKFCQRCFNSKLILPQNGETIFEGNIESFMKNSFLAVTQKAGCYLINMETQKVAVVYRDYLNDWSFPKGHLEEGETLQVCAVRETAEETKRVAKIIDNLEPIVERYTTPLGEHCDCYMYIAVDMGKSDNTSDDTHPTFWIDINEVEEKLSYPGLKTSWLIAKKIIEENLF